MRFCFVDGLAEPKHREPIEKRGRKKEILSHFSKPEKGAGVRKVGRTASLRFA